MDIEKYLAQKNQIILIIFSSEKFNPSNYRPLLPPGGARPRIMEDFISNGGRFNFFNAIIISIILSIDQRSESEGGAKDVKFSLIFCMLKSSHQDLLVIMGFSSKGRHSLQQLQIRG